MKRKKGYFFVLDAIMAIMVLTIGVILIFSFNKYAPLKQQAFFISSDIPSMLANTKIKDLNNEYCGVNSKLTNDGNITNTENTLLEQIGEFYYRSKTKGCTFCPNLTIKAMQNTVTPLVPEDYNFYIKINSEVVYTRNTTDIQNATLVIPVRRVVQGLYNKSELFGPYIFEVYTWK
jgi:hypothetical protein